MTSIDLRQDPPVGVGVGGEHREKFLGPKTKPKKIWKDETKAQKHPITFS